MSTPEFDGQPVVGIATPAGHVDFHPCATREEAFETRALFAEVFPGATVWVGIKTDGTVQPVEGGDAR